MQLCPCSEPEGSGSRSLAEAGPGPATLPGSEQGAWWPGRGPVPCLALPAVTLVSGTEKPVEQVLNSHGFPGPKRWTRALGPAPSRRPRLAGVTRPWPLLCSSVLPGYPHSQGTLNRLIQLLLVFAKKGRRRSSIYGFTPRSTSASQGWDRTEAGSWDQGCGHRTWCHNHYTKACPK